MIFELKTIGRQLEPRPIINAAICLDLVSVWASNPNKAQLFRICAAAIGCAIDHTARLPKYRYLDGAIMEYGGRILERLLEAGITPSAIVEYGTHVLALCVERIPSDDEIEAQADFLAPPPAAD